MKAIINGQLYNTDTAEILGRWNNGKQVDSFDRLDETLCRTKKGAFFILFEGGARTSYCTVINGTYYSGHEILPVSKEAAIFWGEERRRTAMLLKHFSNVIKEA